MNSENDVLELLGPIWSKNPILQPKSFFKIFIVTFAYLQYNFKELIRVDSEDKVYELLGPVWGKNAPFCGQ